MSRYKYTLTSDGKRRCENNEFYLQATPKYRGYTEKIFKALFGSEPKTMAEISHQTGINRCSVNGILTFNITTGYIRRLLL